jgi:sugar transferase (PEP-CTERM system associated)
LPYIRVFRHYIHTPLLYLSIVEGVLIASAAYLGYYSRHLQFPVFLDYLMPSLVFGFLSVVCMVAMGVYEARIREGMLGMSLRTGVALFLLGTTAVALVSYLFPSISMGRGELLFASLEAFIMISVFRWLYFGLIDEDRLKKRVIVLGTGRRALKIASRMRRRYDQRAFKLIGFFQLGQDRQSDLVTSHGASVIQTSISLPDYCSSYGVQELVVAMDERRRNVDAEGGLPLEDLLECRLRGIQVCDVQQFIEREACKVDVDLLRPSWLVFSDGFVTGAFRSLTKRSFDIAASLVLLFFTWPIMLLAAICIRLEDGSPVFYRQTRTGLDNVPFDVIKFRSMRTDAEHAGNAVWAAENDPRVTRVGAFMRKTRIDELPQLLNVLRGDMSFVGPRPERPIFVNELNEKIPFYTQRHRVKPGITGWAQLCYPYGASVEDAKEKLQYDLYYLKNHSLLLDMIILLQTVEVVLVGEGAR